MQRFSCFHVLYSNNTDHSQQYIAKRLAQMWSTTRIGVRTCARLCGECAGKTAPPEVGTAQEADHHKRKLHVS